jgi:hypothetical protein
LNCIIKIPARNSDNFGDPVELLLSYTQTINSCTENCIRIDLNSCQFISPFLIGGLSVLIQRAKNRGIQVNLDDRQTNPSFLNYLHTIYFPGGYAFPPETSTYESMLSSYHSKTYLPLVIFGAGTGKTQSEIREKILSAVNSIFKNQLNLSGNILQAIFYMVDELTQNIVDHSGSECGSLFAQFYPSKNYMDICVADVGVGLFQSYMRSGKFNPQNDQEALNYAIYGKSTKPLPESRGFGISTSRRMLVEGLKGKFLMLSGTAMYYQAIDSQNIAAIPHESNFPGTYIALRIPVLENQQFRFYKYVE